MAVTVWDATFKPVGDIAYLRDGSEASCNVKKDTTEVYFRWSPDGVNWSAAPHLVADFGNSAGKIFNIEEMADGSLKVHNALDRIYQSTNRKDPDSWEAL